MTPWEIFIYLFIAVEEHAPGCNRVYAWGWWESRMWEEIHTVLTKCENTHPIMLREKVECMILVIIFKKTCWLLSRSYWYHAWFSRLYTDYLTKCQNQPCEAGTVFSFISEMRKVWPREVNKLTHGHTVHGKAEKK